MQKEQIRSHRYRLQNRLYDYLKKTGMRSNDISCRCPNPDCGGTAVLRTEAYGEPPHAFNTWHCPDCRRITMLLVHHTRKMQAEDPMDLLSGTTGIAGAADGALILRRTCLKEALPPPEGEQRTPAGGIRPALLRAPRQAVAAAHADPRVTDVTDDRFISPPSCVPRVAVMLSF